VALPDNSTITSTHIAELALLPLPKEARTAHLFPALQGTSLLSIGKLCDAGCTATFTKHYVTITFQNKPLLTGNRCQHTGLWQVPLHTAPQLPQANLITATSTTADMVKFSHAALFSPRLSTLKTALEQNYIKNFPGLTAATLKKHPPHSIATAKGHLDQKRANIQSTKKPLQPDPDVPHDESFPTTIPNGHTTNACFAALESFHQPTRQVHTDQTGAFPVTSTRGIKYVFILYDYDSNSIHPIPIKNRSAESILEAYQKAHNKLVQAGLCPKLHRLDNECSQILKDYMTNQQEDYQLVPPGIHRRNAAERAIRTFKNHLIAGLSTADPNFPLNLWDRLLDQAYITLNLLRGSRMNPKLSAYAQIEGEFDYNRTPIAPPGIRVVVHEKPQERGSWATHGKDGWYIGPAMESYRCFKTYIWSTKAERITDTIEWFPHSLKMPQVSDIDVLLAATTDILNILQKPSQNSHFPALTETASHQLKQITQLFHNHINQTNPPISQNTIIIRPPAPPLRVQQQENLSSTPPPAPVLRVPTTHSHPPTHSPTNIPIVTQEEDSNEQQPPQQPPAATITQETDDQLTQEDPPPQLLQPAPDETYAYNKIISHQLAPRGSGSTYQVEVEWSKHPPTFVPINIFTEHGENITAWNTVAEYAIKNKLTKIKGWKQFTKKPTKTPSLCSTQIQQDTPTDCRNFFQRCLHVTESANKAINPDTGKLSEYHSLLQSTDGQHWEESCCEEIGRLAQGYPPTVPEGTNTIHFIRFDQIPAGRKATYLRLVVSDRPMKSNPRRVRFTVGGDKVDYPFEVRTKTADLTTAKIIINSTISTPGARFMCMDIKDFYLNNDMSRYEYMRIPINQIPQRIMELYKLAPLVHNGAVYVEIRKGMYGLPQAGKIANDKLIPILKAAGYHQSDHTPGLFKHEHRPIAFCLVVDDFGVKYVGKEHAEHLANTLTSAGYKLTLDWEGNTFCGINLNWDYANGTVDLSMPGYIEKALQRFEHPQPPKPEDSPYAWTRPNYGAKQQMTEAPDISPPLDQKGIKQLQEVIGTLLFYGRAIDNTMLVALGTLASAQTKGTQATAKALVKLLNYAATHPNAILRYTASGMILHIDSDASYLSEAEARSRAGGYFYLSDHVNVDDKTAPPPKLNGAIHIVCIILQNVMSSATEAEVGALFHNAQDGCMIRNTLEFLGHPQPPTPIKTDNSCAEGIANDTVKQKRSKAIDMRFYWLRDRVRQNQFKVYWRKGEHNHGDYFTKHHPTPHHRVMRPIYLHEKALSLIKIHC
jgi:hypothetical protein